MERPPVVIDVDAVKAIAGELLQIGSELARQTRPLRLPMMNPASDPFTVQICSQIDHARASLGAVGSDAGEELTRMAEFVLSSAFNLHHIARWTGLVISGISSAPLAPRNLDIVPRPARGGLRQHQVLRGWSMSTDSEVLGCAALLSAGDQHPVEPYFPDPRALRALGDRMRASAAQLQEAWPRAESAAAKYQAFARWIGAEFTPACERSSATMQNWATLYGEVNALLNKPATGIVSTQAALLDGTAVSDVLNPASENDIGRIDAQAIRELLDPYASFDGAIDLCIDYPRLKL
jgi:hypothetical protein